MPQFPSSNYTRLPGENRPQIAITARTGANILQGPGPGRGSLAPGKRNHRARVLRATPWLRAQRGEGQGHLAGGFKSKEPREAPHRNPAATRRRRWERRVLGGGRSGDGREGDNGGKRRRWSRPPSTGGWPSLQLPPARAPPHLALAPRPAATPVPLLGRDPRPPSPQLPPRPPPRPQPLEPQPPPARPPRTHLPRRAPGREGGEGLDSPERAERGEGAAEPGGRGRAPARARHLPLPAARAAGARLGRQRRGRGGTAPPPTAPSGGRSRHRQGVADAEEAPKILVDFSRGAGTKGDATSRRKETRWREDPL